MKKQAEPRLIFVTEAARMMRRSVEDFKRLYIRTGLIPVILESDNRMMIDPRDLDLYNQNNKYQYNPNLEESPAWKAS